MRIPVQLAMPLLAGMLHASGALNLLLPSLATPGDCPGAR